MATQSPVLLSDEPATDDSLGGAHKRIAGAIAALCAKSPGGKCIRLDGEWGTGKSTVVRLLARKLDDVGGKSPNDPGAADCAVFLYDVWVHSGDPLKRAFFAALLDKFQQKQWLSSTEEGKQSHASSRTTREYWNEQLDVLSSLVKRSERKEVPSFSLAARVALALLVAFGASVPYILKVLSGVEDSIGSAAVGTLVFVIVFAVVRYIPERILNYFLLRNSDTKRTETRGDYVPTSVDFQEVFGKLMATTMDGHNRRVIVVVDNLDRISEPEIREVWGLLRSFLDNPAFTKTSWFQKLWVIVPVANAPRLAAFVSRDEDKQTASGTFLEKAFQVRFGLPPPMLHAWKSFMRAKLQQAFGVEDGGEYEDVQRIYEIYLSQRRADDNSKTKTARTPASAANTRAVSARVTPRAIVAFINDLVAMALEHSDIGLPVLSAFHLAQAFGDNDENGLPTILPQVKNVIHNARLPDIWAMLQFHAADIDEASYIVAYPILDGALPVGDISTVKDQLDKSPGAVHIIQRYIHEGLAELRGISLVRAAYVLDTLLLPTSNTIEEIGPESKVFSERTISTFRDVVERQLELSERLEFDDDLIVASVTSLFHIIPSENKVAQLVVKLLDEKATPKRGIPTVSDSTKPKDNGWLPNLESIVSLPPVKRLLESDGASTLHLSVSASEWAEMISRFCGNESSWILRVVRPQNIQEIQMGEWLAQYMLFEELAPEREIVLNYFITESESNFTDVASKLIGAFAKPQAGNPRTKPVPSIDRVLSAVSKMIPVNPARMRDFLRGWANDEVMLGLFNAERKAENYTSLTKWALLALWIAEGKLPPSWAPSRPQTLPANRAGVSTTALVPPMWTRTTRDILLDGQLSGKIDEQQLLKFVFDLRLFSVLGYPEFASGIVERLLSLVARSKYLQGYLEQTGQGAMEFSVTHFNGEAQQRRFIAEMEAGLEAKLT